jgi:ABC-type Fe3+ transport system permease subunit
MDQSRPDVLAWVVLLVPPATLLTVSIWRSWRVSDAQTMLAGVALIIGGGLAAFGQLASWRARLAEKGSDGSAQKPERDSIDEATAHLLWATWVAVFTTPFLVVTAETDGDRFKTGLLEWIPRVASALSFSLGLYLLLVLGMVLPKLYDAYASAYKLPAEMDGHIRN